MLPALLPLNPTAASLCAASCSTTQNVLITSMENARAIFTLEHHAGDLDRRDEEW